MLPGVAFLGAFLVLLSGCGRSEPRPPGSNPDATQVAVATKPLQPGDTRFLLARRNAIEDITLSGQAAGLVTLEDNVNILEVALSADGQHLAFVVELPAYTNEQGQIDFGADLYVSDIDGSNLRRLVEHDSVGAYYEAPSWLDNSTILIGWRGFDESGGTNRIERIDVATGAREVVLQDAAMGGLSPDRRSIVYTTIDPKTRVQRLVIEDIATNDTPRVLVDEYAGLALFSAVTFSPDGSELAFAAVDLSTTASRAMPPVRQESLRSFGRTSAMTHSFAEDVWLIDPSDGTGLHRVADIAENMPSVTWSGDGSSIYVLGPNFLWRLDPATSGAEMLRQSGEPGYIVWLEGN